MVTLPNGKTLKVKIDHDSLKIFLEQRISLEEQQKWVTKMLGYDFEIIYKKESLMLLQMHSQERMKRQKHFFVPFLL